ncbi:DUF86 domain-containing protein [Azorhizobium oxalatiphilum]|uniref:DUF86 domain-containing protein n=1 Tax=Azorhizobium oxalatiphilum TaxID=980631 RepID=A0A917C9C8_9HYPH|nr:HepT-like ribonuclease domain-containing protein [Azorhizobium oxalatiphilum]GGF75004.1 DUF86 domain-containing protein [Azorhizobium oxalatiphilum]
MGEREIFRVRDMKQSIEDIRALLEGRSPDILVADRMVRAAYERFLEILSEASRHVPEAWKQEVAPDVPWRRIADLGNHLRHVYNRVDVAILWDIYAQQLDALEHAVDQILVRFAAEP